MPSVALAQGFGRIGCFLAGCCYGRETDSIISVTFQNSDFAPNHVALIPTQLYSSILDFLHFGILLYIARRKKADGQVAAFLPDFLQYRKICAGIFPWRFDPWKCGKPIDFTVYQPVYSGGRNCDSDYTYKK